MNAIAHAGRSHRPAVGGTRHAPPPRALARHESRPGPTRGIQRQTSPTPGVRTQPLILVLADISGYTRFVQSHRCSHACAEHIVSELLEAVVVCAEAPLQLHQLLGDAAFFYAVSDGTTTLEREVFDQVQRMRERFRERARDATGEGPRCACGAARDASGLKLKVILHRGPAAIVRLSGIVNLIGEDVILAHRLLKNSVPADEYVLATSAFQRHLGEPVGQWSEQRRERCDGVGEAKVTVYYPERERPPATHTAPPFRITSPARIAAGARQRLFGPYRPQPYHWGGASAVPA